MTDIDKVCCSLTAKFKDFHNQDRSNVIIVTGNEGAICLIIGRLDYSNRVLTDSRKLLLLFLNRLIAGETASDIFPDEKRS
jgi:hypothetical protein